MRQAKYGEYNITSQIFCLKEKFGNPQIYDRNAQSILNKATGFIAAYDSSIPIGAVNTAVVIAMQPLLALIKKCDKIGENG